MLPKRLPNTLLFYFALGHEFSHRAKCMAPVSSPASISHRMCICLCSVCFVVDMALCCGHECEFGHPCGRVSCDNCVRLTCSPTANAVECVRNFKNGKDKHRSKIFSLSIFWKWRQTMSLLHSQHPARVGKMMLTSMGIVFEVHPIVLSKELRVVW